MWWELRCSTCRCARANSPSKRSSWLKFCTSNGWTPVNSLMWSTGCMAKIQANLLFGASPIRKKTTTSWHLYYDFYMYFWKLYIFSRSISWPPESQSTLASVPPDAMARRTSALRLNGSLSLCLRTPKGNGEAACRTNRSGVRVKQNNHGSPWIYDTCLYCSRFLWYISQMYLQMFIYIVNIRSMCINVHIYLILPVEEYTYSASDAAESRVWVW